MIRVALADDHTMLREALCGSLAAEPDMQVVGDAGDGAATLALVERERPDVLVLDIRMPDINGVEIMRRLKARHDDVKVLALSAYDDKRFVQEMLRAGACGYVTKSAAGAELARGIREVARGGNYLSPEVTSSLVSDLTPRAPTNAPPASCLSAREREVLQLIADGVRTSAIAHELGIAPATVEVHRRNIMRKLGLRTIAELTKYAVKEGLAAL